MRSTGCKNEADEFGRERWDGCAVITAKASAMRLSKTNVQKSMLVTYEFHLMSSGNQKNKFVIVQGKTIGGLFRELQRPDAY